MAAEPEVIRLKPLPLLFSALALAVILLPSVAATGEISSDPTNDYDYHSWRMYNGDLGYYDNRYFEDYPDVPVSNNIVLVAADLYNWPVGYVAPANELSWSVLTESAYDVCWLNPDGTIGREHHEPDGGQIGQVRVFINLYKDGSGIVWRNQSVWLENVNVRLYVLEGDGFYHPFASLHAGAASREVLEFAVHVKSTGQRNQTASLYDMPSTSQELWRPEDPARSCGHTSYADGMGEDWGKYGAMLDLFSGGDLENRSAWYGFTRSIEDELADVGRWHALLSGSYDPAAIAEASAHRTCAGQNITAAQYWLKTGETDSARTCMRLALAHYHLSILIADRTVWEEREGLAWLDDALAGDGELTPREYRLEEIEAHIASEIDMLAGTQGGLIDWLLSPTGALLGGMAAALIVIAAVWRNGIAWIMAVCALAAAGAAYATGVGL